MKAKLSSSQSSPRNTITRIVKAAKWSLQSLHVRQQIRLRDINVVQNNLTSHTGTETELSFDNWSAKALEEKEGEKKKIKKRHER